MTHHIGFVPTIYVITLSSKLNQGVLENKNVLLLVYQDILVTHMASCTLGAKYLIFECVSIQMNE